MVIFVHVSDIHDVTPDILKKTIKNNPTPSVGQNGFYVFDCVRCGNFFRDLRSLAEHIFIHTRGYPYACPVCYVKIQYPEKLEKHFRMEDCKKQLRVKYVSENQIFAPIIIDSNNKISDSLEKTKSDPTLVALNSTCPIKTPRKPLATPMAPPVYNEDGTVDEKPFKCPTCNKEFRHQMSMEIHSMIHRSNMVQGEKKESLKRSVRGKNLKDILYANNATAMEENVKSEFSFVIILLCVTSF